MLTVKENIIIIFIIFNVAVKKSPYAEKSITYTDQINVYPILYPHDQSELQLKINWQKTNLKDETINIDVKPLDNGVYYCQGSTCYEYGIFPNTSEIALPKQPAFVEYHECPIKPGCHYNIRVVSSNNTISVDYTYAVPDCVENICSCAHQYSIPSVALSARVNTLNTVLLEWSIPDSIALPKSIYYENITIEVSKHQVKSLPWGGRLELLATLIIVLHRKGEFIQNSTEIVYLTELLAPGERIDISAHISDNRGCSGNMSKTVANVPDAPVVQTKPQTSPENDLWLLQFIIPLVLIVVVSIAVAPWIIRRIKKKYEVAANWRGVYRNVTHNSMTNVIMEDNVLYTDKDILEARARGKADYFEIPHSCLHLGSEIGKGAFGRVLIARADNLGGRLGKQLVAVKQLKPGATNNELDEFLDEITTLKKVGKHPNIVNLLGCCTIKQPLLMVMEYVGCGDLLQYLRTLRQKHEEKIASITGEVRSIGNFSRNSNSISSHGINGKYIDIIHSSNSNTTTSEGSYITQPEVHPQPSHPSQIRPSVSETTYTLLSDNDGSAVTNPLEYVLNHNELHSFAIQIARGMKHLEDKQITHRDLAARNVLIDNYRTLKISDFGLSRSGVYVNTKTKKVPLRWLSVEAMRDNLYSSKSDVWAFGIVLWEIGTLGGFPYPSINNHELLPFLVSGQRLDRPENCSEKLYDIMKQCWTEKPEMRPSFHDLVMNLEPQQEKIYIDFDELSSDYVFPPTNVDLNPKP